MADPMEEPKTNVPSDGYIVGPEAYPASENAIAIEMTYFESPEDYQERKHKCRRFFIRKDEARALAQGIMEILAMPDTDAAWDEIARVEGEFVEKSCAAIEAAEAADKKRIN